MIGLIVVARVFFCFRSNTFRRSHIINRLTPSYLVIFRSTFLGRNHLKEQIKDFFLFESDEIGILFLKIEIVMNEDLWIEQQFVMNSFMTKKFTCQ